MGNWRSGRHGRRAEDLSGRQFGLWLVKSRADNNHWDQIMWNCVCECGWEARVTGKSLREGKSTNCGCVAHKKLSERMKKHWENNGMTESQQRARKRRRTFKRWLATQIDRDDPIGDLAKDAKADPAWRSAKISQYSDAESFLRNKRACFEAMETLEFAYREWELYRRNPDMGRIDWWADGELEGADFDAYIEAVYRDD